MIRKSTILAFCLFLLAGVCAPVRADDRTIIAAATANAVDSLHEDVASARIDARFTVGDFLKAVDGNDELNKTLERAEQVGGPRFSADGGVCQVQLQMSAQRVAGALINIAAARPNKSPLPAEVLARKLADWHGRMFTGSGTSISGAKIELVRPRPSPNDPWGDVSDAARKQAVDAARDDAVHKAIDSIRQIPLAAGRSIGDEMSVQAFKDSIGSWLSSRPIRRVQFDADHQVDLTLSTPPSEYCDEVLAAARASYLPLPDGPGTAAIYETFSHLPAVFTGRAAASASAPTSAASLIELPNRPPAWTEQSLMAEGISDATGNKLKTARVAESEAIKALRTTVYTLPLTSSLTIGDAVKKSPEISRAVEHCLGDARPYKVDYRADGTVSVKSSMNPRELWTEIAAAQQQ